MGSSSYGITNIFLFKTPIAPQMSKTLLAIRYQPGQLDVLNQILIPTKFEYDRVRTVEDAHDAIVRMRVRGAPAIAVVAALAVAVDPGATSSKTICAKLDYLATSRPTAVNLHTAVADLKSRVKQVVGGDEAVRTAYVKMAEAIYAADTHDNEKIMFYGAERIVSMADKKKSTKFNILTHCNTGALATTKYGTALGVVRKLFYDGNLEHLYCTETRPWNQGARLTYFEAGYEGIPTTLIADSAAAALMRERRIDAVIVGADRVCSNGDTANKIGTYSLALVAKAHGVPFYVAAPWTSIDMALADGSKITIEIREGKELTHNMQTGARVVAEGPTLGVWNPAFDVTPAALITGGIITERGVIACKDLGKKSKL